MLSARDQPRASNLVNDEGGAASPGSAEPGQSSALGRIIAYIPAELIATYQAVQGLFADGAGRESDGVRLSGLALLLMTPFWVAFVTRGPREPIAWHQVGVSTFAFALWLYGVGNPLLANLFGPWTPQAGSAAIFVGALLLTIVDAVLARLAAGRR